MTEERDEWITVSRSALVQVSMALAAAKSAIECGEHMSLTLRGEIENAQGTLRAMTAGEDR